MKDQIISFIKTNRISTTEVMDCLDKRLDGSVLGIQAVNRGHSCVGEVFYTYACGSSNWKIHEDIQQLPPQTVLWIDVFDCEERGIIGELVTKYALLYKQAVAVVINGNIRDAGHIIKENYSVWCRGYNPVGCFNTPGYADIPESMQKERLEYYHGAVAVCDDCGIALIPKSFHTPEFYERLKKIEEQEDIWFDCIDRRKWSTFDTVCLKKYLIQEDEHG